MFNYWSSALKVGDPIIDSQHYSLFILLEELDEREKDLDEVLHDLFKYTDTHFFYEENLIREKHGEKVALEHSDLHTQFIEDITKLAEESFKIKDYKKLRAFILQWLTNHILEKDVPLLQD